MRKYEVILILDPGLEDEQRDNLLKEVQDLIKKNDGEFLDMNLWGKKRLAYPINNFEDGFYVLITFNGQISTVDELNRVMRLRDSVIRFLITKAA